MKRASGPVAGPVAGPCAGPPRDPGGGLLDTRRPLRLRWAAGAGGGGAGVMLAVVSVAWLRALDGDALERLRCRHLSVPEAEFGRALPSAKRRYEWLAGRLAVKHGVCAYLRGTGGAAPPARAVRVTPVAAGPTKGRPYVNAPAEVGLSHSADFAVAACGPRPVGVDLERVRPLAPPLTALLARDTAAGTSAAAGRLPAMPDTVRWACKEAVLKHYGVGLRVDAGEVALTSWHDDGTFTWRPGARLRAEVPAAADPVTGWAGETSGYALALVWR